MHDLLPCLEYDILPFWAFLVKSTNVSSSMFSYVLKKQVSICEQAFPLTSCSAIFPESDQLDKKASNHSQLTPDEGAHDYGLRCWQKVERHCQFDSRLIERLNLAHL